jgi:hypothetical protein
MWLSVAIEEAPTMPTRKTPTAAKELGTTYHRLISLLRSEKLSPPAKDSSGDYVWSDADLEAARKALSIDRRKKEFRA